MDEKEIGVVDGSRADNNYSAAKAAESNGQNVTIELAATMEDGSSRSAKEIARSEEELREKDLMNIVHDPDNSDTSQQKPKQESLEEWVLIETPSHVPRRSLANFCCLPGSVDSEGCPPASDDDLLDILHHSRLILGAYGKNAGDLTKLIQEQDPRFDGDSVVKFEHPAEERGSCPPYFISVHQGRREVAMYIRGLNLLHKDDYITLMSNRIGEQEFHGGYVHYGMHVAASWCVKHVAPTLQEQLLKHEGYRLTIVGHSLGAGVAAIFTCILVENPELIGGIDKNLIRAYAIAPPRVLSFNLSIRYQPNIYSVIYEDDFLPRISTSTVKSVFRNAFALKEFVLLFHWIKQAIVKSKVEKDIYRLHPPGLIFHIVYKKPGVMGKVPIHGRVVHSSQGRFDWLVLSTGTATDHSVLKLAKNLKKFAWPPGLRNQV